MMIRGCIGFTTNKHSQISAIIRWFTSSPWSHSFLIADNSPDTTYVIEANEGGVDIRSWNSDYGNPSVCPTEVYQPTGVDPKVMSDAFLQARAKYEGKTYGYLELIGIGVKIFFARVFRANVYDPIRQGCICSQFVLFYLTLVCPDLFSKLDANCVSPADIYKIVQANPTRFTRVS